MKIEKKLITANFSSSRMFPIKAIVVHHTACVCSIQSLYNLFNCVSHQASAHYGIDNYGTIAQFVEENNTAWHVGKSRNPYVSNANTIGIEVSNSNINGWEVSDASIDLLVKLIREIAMRNNLLPLVYGINVFGHRDLAATLCPGPFLYPKLNEIIEKVNKIL